MYIHFEWLSFNLFAIFSFFLPLSLFFYISYCILHVPVPVLSSISYCTIVVALHSQQPMVSGCLKNLGCLSDLKINDIEISIGDLVTMASQETSTNIASRNLPISSSSSSSSRYDHNTKFDDYSHWNRLQQDKKTIGYWPNIINSKDKEMKLMVEIRIIQMQNVNNGCRTPVDLCATVNCRPPFRCVDEWMLAKCRSVFGIHKQNSTIKH